MDTAATVNEAPPRVDWSKGWPALVSLDPKATRFMAGAKLDREYRVYESVSFERYQAYELLQVEVGLARTFQQFQDQIDEAYLLCNQVASGKPVFADLAVLLRDLKIGTMLVGERQTHAVLKMCCLFINREGEDLRYIDEALIESKVDDWRAAGIDMAFFFQFALRSIPGFFDAYRAISHDTSARDLARAQGGSTSKSDGRPSAAGTSDSSPP